jgi:[protein-PII] uridylyltransferase
VRVCAQYSGCNEFFVVQQWKAAAGCCAPKGVLLAPFVSPVFRLKAKCMQTEIERLRREFREGRSELFKSLNWSSPSRELLEAHSSLIDQLLKEIYEISCRAADLKARRTRHSGLAIVATGGYGRRELNPYSDIDVAFIPSEEEDPWVEAVVHTAFKLVMDSFLSLRDVHVGYAFRPIADASSWDVATKTALLDLRYICGDRVMADRLQERIREVLSPLDLMLEAASAKSPKQSRSMYLVEPSIKEGPGSLRDLHRARWIFKLLYGVDDSSLESALRDRAGISDRQISEVREAADWFWRVRTWLHLSAGKLSDVLIINYQDRIAGELGGCGSQEWLSKHLAHSETLARFRESAVRTLLQGPFHAAGVRLEFGSFRLQDSSSGTDAVKMLHLSQLYAIPVSLKTQKLLGDARDSALEVCEPSADEMWALHQILGQSRGASATLRALAEYGILDRFVPGYSEVMRFVPPDPAHRFTVGEHSLRMIEHLEDLSAGGAAESQRFTELLRQCSHFDMLVLSCLLHDAGKLVPGNDHSETSADLAKSVAARLNLAPEKRELLDILVRHHLLLVRTARLHDLKSANVIRKVAERVPSLEALQHLYVFTFVDTSAVGEKNWTSMDFRDLEDLYEKMQDFYAGEGADASEGGPREDKSVLVRKKLVALRTAKNEAAVQRHCDAMPAGYILNTPLEEIAFHLQLLERLEAERVVLDVYNRPGDDYTELTLCTYDDPQPGMLSKITGVLYGCNADIHKAQAFTMVKEHPVVLDTLWVRSNGMQISEGRARKIQSAMKEVLAGSVSIGQFLKKAGKTPPEGIVLDTIDLRNDLSEEHTVVHIIAGDLQGLLYLMTRGLSRCGLDIHSAKIATWNTRAENNFYVTAAQGGQIPDSELPSWTDRLSCVLRASEFSNPAR